MFTDLVGVASGAGSYASVVLEVESSQKYRRGQQGLLRLHARGEGLDGDTVVELTAVSGLLASLSSAILASALWRRASLLRCGSSPESREAIMFASP